MKRAMAALVMVAAVAGMALGQGAKVELRPGETVLKSFPVAIAGYDAPACVSVQALGPSVLKLSAGAKAATGTLSLIFETGATEAVQIEVVDDATRYLRALKACFAQEVALTVREKDGALLGEVKDYAAWRQVELRLREVAERFGVKPTNLVRFGVGDEVAAIAREVTALGYVVKPQVTAASPLNELAIEARNGRVVVTGKTYSAEAHGALLSAIGRVGHLAINREAQAGELPCEVAVTVDKYLSLSLRVAIAVVTEDDYESYGRVNSLSVNSIVDFVWERDNGSSSRSRSRSATAGGSVGIGTGDFQVNNQFGRAMRTNRVDFTNHQTEPTHLHVGGTLLVNTGASSEEDGDLKEIEYGLTVDVSGGLISPTEVACDLEIKQDDAPEQLGESAYISGKKTELKTKQKRMRLGETYVLSNNRDVEVSWSEPSGTPVLRHIPLIKWFFSSEYRKVEKATVLLLVSPELTNPEALTMPTSEESGKVLKSVLDVTDKH